MTLDIELEKKKYNMWEILQLSWATIPGTDR